MKLTKHVNNKSVVFGNYDKMDPSSLDTRNYESNSFRKKDSLRKRSSINKSIENNLEGDKFINSYTSDFRKLDNIVLKIAICNNLSRNNGNISNLFYKSNINTEMKEK